MSTRGLLSKFKSAVQRASARGFYWHVPDGSSSAEAQAVRTVARRLMHCQWPTPLRQVAGILAIAGWPWFAFREARMLHRVSNPKACPANLRRKAWLAAMRYNLPAAEYGAFGLWHPDSAPPDAWLYTLESATLTGTLTDQAVSDLCGDKVAFARFCTANSTHAVAPTLAIYRDGAPLQCFEDDTPPRTDLISKPVRTSKGHGFEIWKWQDDAFHSTHANRKPLPPAAQQQLFETQSLEHPSGLLIQPALGTHPDLANLAASGPPVARIITGRWPDGRVEVLDAMLQKPMTGRLTTHGGPYRLIDLDTGQLVARRTQPHIFPSATDDPSFDGLQMPGWQTSIAQLIHLHSLLDGQAPLLGWDVVYTPDGPTILEANTTLAPYFFQLATQQPAANGKWMSLLAEYLRRDQK